MATLRDETIGNLEGLVDECSVIRPKQPGLRRPSNSAMPRVNPTRRSSIPPRMRGSAPESLTGAESFKAYKDESRSDSEPMSSRIGVNRMDSLLDDARRLRSADLGVVFQPIVSASSREVFAYEALTRCKHPSFPAPHELFEIASKAGTSGKLGRLVRDVAVEKAPGHTLFLNLHPDEITPRILSHRDDPIFLHDSDVYLEITESAEFRSRTVALEVLKELLRHKHIQLAVDDLGAEYSNLKRVLDLEPAIVKLDRALITGLAENRRQRVLVTHLVRLCRDLGAKVVAEGIETVDELNASIDCGVQLLQGFLLARPGYPLPRASWPGAHTIPPMGHCPSLFPEVRGSRGRRPK